MKPDPETRELAWIGDSILSLFVREWLLKDSTIQEAERNTAYTLFTSNQFLSGLGEPSRVEAEIGRIYRNKGLSGAFLHIETVLLPHFQKQWKNRHKFRRIK